MNDILLLVMIWILWCNMYYWLIWNIYWSRILQVSHVFLSSTNASHFSQFSSTIFFNLLKLIENQSDETILSTAYFDTTVIQLRNLKARNSVKASLLNRVNKTVLKNWLFRGKEKHTQSAHCPRICWKKLENFGFRGGDIMEGVGGRIIFSGIESGVWRVRKKWKKCIITVQKLFSEKPL